ncbi:ComEA family DNA-binding protein [Phaeodactylibacter xiamenensis]|uniref:ComEA family DNA-binding protein n=1 Tax=Phaeodactylibacter xiamenensis TaxID=1524460 RepID=UPI003CCC0600
MNDWLKDYFYYTKSERNGAWVLAVLIFTFALLPLVYPLLSPPTSVEFDDFEAELEAFLMPEAAPSSTAPEPALFYFDPNTLPLDSLQLLGLSRKTATTIVRFREKVKPFRQPEDLQDIYTLSEEDYARIAPYIRILNRPTEPQGTTRRAAKAPAPQRFAFDPNTLSGDSLMLLGLSGRTVRTLINYRDKGGQFRQPEDLKKIYGLPPDQAKALMPYVSIPKGEPRPESQAADAEAQATPPRPEATEPPTSIRINTAAPEEWQALQGIGPAFARRICGFRDKLGGFAHVDQVGETYGLPDSTFQRIRPQLVVDQPVQRLRINHLDATGLKAHPYLTWKHANAIIAYRGQHGAFTSAAEVAKIRSIPAEVLKKMEPYWSFE